MCTTTICMVQVVWHQILLGALQLSNVCLCIAPHIGITISHHVYTQSVQLIPSSMQ